MFACSKLQVLPSTMNLASHKVVNVAGCSRLRKFPDFSTNISSLKLSNTLVEQVPVSIQHWTRLRFLELSYNGKLKTLKNVPKGVSHLNLSYNGIENVSDCIKVLQGLQHLNLSGCRKLATLPICKRLWIAEECFLSLLRSNFTNCFELSQQARRAIIQQSFLNGWALLPGSEVPAEFDHRARGSSLTLPYPASSRFKICLVVAPNHQVGDYRVSQLLCSRIGKCELNLSSIDEAIRVYRIPRFLLRMERLKNLKLYSH